MSNIFFLLSVSEPFFAKCIEFLRSDPGNKSIYLSAFSYCNEHDNDLSGFDRVVYFKDVLSQRNEKDMVYFLNEAKRMELEYDFILSDLIHTERNFDRFSKQDAFCIAVLMALKIEEVNRHKKIAMVVSEGLDDFLSMFLYFFSRKNDIPFRYPVRSRIGTGLYLSDGPDGNVVARSSRKNEKTTLEAESYIDDYLKEKIQPSYMISNRRFFKVASKQDFLTLAKKSIQKERKTTFHAYESTAHILKKRLVRIVSAARYMSVLKKHEVDMKYLSDMGLDFFIYPLHFHPEASTLVKGRWINNQLQIIEFISKSLPANYMLLVKEHKVSIGRRERDFYREIIKHHNVMLVSHNLNPHDLIQRSRGVVTISSSMGLEAIFHNKPVICFGDVFYNKIRGVEKARDITRIYDYVSNAINFKGYSKADVQGLIHEILTCSVFPETDFSPHSFSDEHCEAFLSLLEEDIDSLVDEKLLSHGTA